MIKLLNNKKLLLLLLTVIFLIILFSAYIRTSDRDFSRLYTGKDNSAKNELLLKKDRKEERNSENKKENKNNESSKIGDKSETEITNIALVEEIKDPFKKTQASQKTNSAKVKTENSSIAFDNQLNSNKNLIFLERNIIAENMIRNMTGSDEKIQSEKTINFETGESIKQNGQVNNAAQNKENIKKIKLPFTLVGIIKNNKNSSALFQYQGKTIMKNEKDKIDRYKIEKINNKKITISYQKDKRTLHLWGAEKNEN